MELWKICNKLFGWEYCIFRYGYEIELKRLRSFPDGTGYVKFLGEIMLVEDLRQFKIITTNR